MHSIKIHQKFTFNYQEKWHSWKKKFNDFLPKIKVCQFIDYYYAIW